MFRYVIIILTILLSIVLTTIFHRDEYIDFTCEGAFQNYIHLSENEITSNGNLIISISRGNKVYVSIDALTMLNKQSHHYGRVMIYEIKPIDKKMGLFSIKHIGGSKNATDTIPSGNITSQLFGTESTGRIIKIKKISKNVIIFGNLFSPIYSCTVEN